MSVEIHFPVSFVLERVDLNWHDVRFGLERGFLHTDDVVHVAIDRVSHCSHPTNTEISLAGILSGEAADISRFLDELAPFDETHRSAAAAKWLYLVLAWVFEHHASFEDVFSVVAEVYADFGYPEDVGRFVYYMPTSDGYRPQDHTPEENRGRLLRLWQDYLESCGRVYGAAKGERSNNGGAR